MTPRSLAMRPSSNVASATYDDETQTLTVTFQKGGSYVYRGIGQDTVDGLESSPSPGSFVARHLKGRGVKA